MAMLQVRFVYEALKKLRPGVPLRALHGGMKQMKRMAVFYEYCQVRALRGSAKQMKHLATYAKCTPCVLCVQYPCAGT